MALTDAARAAPPQRRATFIRKWLAPVAALLVALGVPVVMAAITGASSSEVTEGVERVSSSASNRLDGLSSALPLGYAFGAGMVSAVNPCGFTMLPAYLGMYVGEREGGERRSSLGRLGQAFVVGAAVTAGFAVLFAAAGLTIGFGARSLVTAFPWIGLGVGVVLAIAGAWLLSGRSLYSSLGERVAARVGDPRESSVRGYFLFGLSYGTASLSCTLPIFLTVVGGSIAVSGALESVGQLVLYALGMGSVILALTLSIAVLKLALVDRLRAVMPYIEPVSSILMLAAGAYIVYYWLTQGELIERLQ